MWLWVFGCAAIISELGRKMKARQIVWVSAIRAVPTLMNVVARVFLGRRY